MHLYFCKGEAFLACGISDGSVSVIRVTQTLREVPDRAGFIKEFESTVSHDVVSDRTCEVAQSGITSLRWIQTEKPNVSCSLPPALVLSLNAVTTPSVFDIAISGIQHTRKDSHLV